jgi:hypothetical protein
VNVKNTKERSGMTTKTDQIEKEYDLNVFYRDLGTNEETGENEWADVFTIQPSVYRVDGEWVSTRSYLESFTLTLAETRMLAPDFPEKEWGDDFFITLDSFRNIAKTIPDRVKALLDSLPHVDSVPEDIDDYRWINTLF